MRGKVGWVSIRLASVYCMTQLLLRVQKPLSLTLQRLCRLLMFRTQRRQCRKGVGGRSDSVRVLVSPICSLISVRVTFTMPFTFSVAEYADMIYVYGFCDGNSVHAVAEYQQRFPNH